MLLITKTFLLGLCHIYMNFIKIFQKMVHISERLPLKQEIQTKVSWHYLQKNGYN